MSLPDREAILAFIRQTPSVVGKREIARAFGLHGAARIELKALLAEMEEEGLLQGGPGRSLHEGGKLPRVAVLKVVSADGGRILAAPEHWQGEGAAPKLLVMGGRDGRKERFSVGDRLLARIGEAAGGMVRATVIRRIGRGQAELLGVVGRDGRGQLQVQPVDRRDRRRFPLHHQDEALPGELVRATLKGSGARTVARIASSLGDPFAGVALSDIAIAEKNIPAHFSEEQQAAAVRAASTPLGAREDWTNIPFLTIDPPDARDHDAAVYAEADGDGFRLLVAIADVSWFVRPGGGLDREAFTRGNSIYFPDRVVPMLPEALSNGACSLKKGEEKAVLAASIHLGADGKLQRWSFHRAKIRVAENLAYEEAQARIDRGEGGALLAPLWACWRALDRARTARQPLEIELPERRVLLDGKGQVAGVQTRERLDAHKVIEDMMIAANVAAAKALEARKAPVLYRCHETPGREKLSGLKEYLGTLGISFALGQVVAPAIFNRVLSHARERADFTEISEAVLRAQTQAFYTPANGGHFGLALPSYAHFTSPIRRYSDILVHRSLVRAFHLGDGGLPDGAGQRFAAIGEHLSFTERRAMEAERETLDRYIARYLSASVGQHVRARITGVQAFGFFASVVDLGGDGLVPLRALGDERFRFDEAGRYLEGVESGVRYAQGQMLDLRLEEADMVTGALRFSIPGVEPHLDDRRPRSGFRPGPRSGPRRGGPPPGVRRKR